MAKVVTSFFLSRNFRLFVLLLLAAALVASIWCLRWLHEPFVLSSDGSHQITFEVQPGDSLSALSVRLQKELGLPYPGLLSIYGRLTHLTQIKHGEYLLPLAASPVELLQLLNEGRVKQHFVTLIEGMTIKDVLELLQQQSGIKQTLAGVDLEALANRLKLSQSHPEGWLFPDTYAYIKGSSDWSIIVQSHERMKKILAQEWQSRSSGLPYETPYEALIMASIVEKETGAPQERAEIAGVFVRRLQKRMRLQTDPTIIYGLGDSYEGNITRRHLKQKTAYNTYVIKGLPPTPIALPGREAIHAAMHPAPGETLYFVARGDGTHIFSTTLSEHQKAVRTFQLKRAEGYRSTIQ